MRRRDGRALAALYDRYAPVLLAHVARLLPDRGEAEGILLETFMRAWERADRYDATRGSVLCWLLVMARTRALDALRATGRRERAAGRAAVEGGGSEAEAPLSGFGPAPDASYDPERGGGGGRDAHAHRGAARGDRARVLRGAHPHRDRRAAVGAARHDQDPHPRRPPAAARRAAPARRGGAPVRHYTREELLDLAAG